MSLLQEQITALVEQFQILKSSSENKIAMQEYAVIIDQLTPTSEELIRQKNDRMLLGNLPTGYLVSGLTPDEMDQVEKVQFSINKFFEIWADQDYKARQDDSLDNAKQAIKVLDNDLSNTNVHTWQAWIGGLVDRFETADAALDSQKDVPSLQKVIQRYRDKREEYRELVRKIPEDSTALEKITTLVDELESLRGNMDFGLPEAVKVFFENISNAYSGYQASLALLTPEVVKWLIEKDELKNFSVRRKSMQ